MGTGDNSGERNDQGLGDTIEKRGRWFARMAKRPRGGCGSNEEKAAQLARGERIQLTKKDIRR